MGEDLRLKEVLGDLTSTRLSNLVVAQVQLSDGLVKHEALDEDSDQVVIDQVSWKGEIGEGIGRTEAILEGSSIGHLHTEKRPLVLHANVLRAIGKCQITQVRKVLENDTNVKVLRGLQLSDDETEDFVTRSIELLLHLVKLADSAELLKKLLDMRFNEGLLETVSVLLFLDVHV